MTPRIFGLAEKNIDGSPDPAHVRLWGMELENGAVLHWREDGRNQVAVCTSAQQAAESFGSLFGLALYFP
ncbi:hypothetical protein [Saccharopolyspora flava]|uniref:Uncharacterized protein n=1 Tax=Saccharopolyspora flava TaxID=95161 RepID=A0A1I6TBI1_9PSEU|nr:hypothetical protein [Saccharopolyspora flava]SFS86483.1 hypothetical protein SAMN05660874_03843 [Saccharopolyspora flava]